ncbi:MAG: NADH-dependent [FeFe] hydrogenase, group A6 [Candidatus Zixiibacteriota bacterium]
MVTLTIDNKTVRVAEGTTIMDAAKTIGINIPSLCAMDEIDHHPGACRICVVEVLRSRNLVASCVYPVAEGMKVMTNSPRVRKARRGIVEFLLSDHPQDCTLCQKNGQCELQALAKQIGIHAIRVPQTQFTSLKHDVSSPALVRDPAKCINCLRCVKVCADIQCVELLAPANRGFESRVVPAMAADLIDSACTFCGQCATVCPTGAIVEKDDTQKVFEALDNPNLHVIVQEAPAIRASLGEEFDMPPGSLVTGKMITALRLLGFDRVFDTNFAADLTIIEEGNELLHRVKTGGTLPMITSCSPGWIKYIEHFYPELLSHVSTCKSPQQMFGAIAKTYYARWAGIDPASMYVVSIMPCTAKKYEASRPEMNSSGYRDVDAVLTTRELARMIKMAGIDFAHLEDSDYDAPMGQYTGAATIFGATGGVMEAAVRTVYEVVTGQTMPNLNLTAVRGLEGVKEAELTVGNLGTVRTAVAHGLGNAKKLLDKIVDGTANFHFIEIMTCPGGCVGGGGQPLPITNAKRLARAAALYTDDAAVQKIRKSHENPAIKTLYQEFLKEPLGELSHKYLHTHYVARGL